MAWLKAQGDVTLISVRVVPRASRTEIAGISGDALRIRLQAPPVDGKANKALLKFLAKQLGIRTSQVAIDTGDTSRVKRIAVTGCDEAAVRHALAGSDQ